MKKENQGQPSPEPVEGYVIGVDGGGTKTIAALSNLKGKILETSKTGSSNLRNVGIKMAVSNISEAILKVIKGIRKGSVLSIFIALAAVEEEFKSEKGKLKKEILKNPKISKVLKGKIEIVSDQIAAFKSGTDERDGLVLISGTGCVCHGWRNKKEAKTGGWGWLNDEGSGFWVGQKGYQAIFKDLDGRGQKTKIKKLLFQEWKLKNKEDLMKKIYGQDSIRNVSLISKIVDKAAKTGDRVAKSIMTEAGKELSSLAISVIKELNFPRSSPPRFAKRGRGINSLRGRHNKKFPLVLVGKTFKSNIALNKVKKEVKKIAPRVKFILPKTEPVIGSVKLAIEKIS
ncbi:MAG: BadF/BadG/BcrA/BcrD ATPase family protein [Candidatus Paceibacterales bacterium]